MMTAEITYQGQLRTKAKHNQSGIEIITDAPVDNHGRGEAFSPTDLVSAALGSCMTTIMGIYAQKHHLNIEGTKLSVQKIMQANPRKISAIRVEIQFPKIENLSEEHQNGLKDAALTCPVALSLHPDIRQEVSFVFA